MHIESAESDMPFTGERYIPNLKGTFALDHWARYLMSCEVASNKAVLDIACGEGYGSALLAEVASSVIGVDVSEEAVNHAKRRYTKSNLEFRVGNCAAIPLNDSSVDLVVSFETLEHHDQHAEMFREIRRVLRSDGLLVISTPDRLEFSKIQGTTPNPYHVKELYRDEFEALLRSNFAYVAMLGQRIVFGSGIFLEDTAGTVVVHTLADEVGSRPQRFSGMARPWFLIGVASNQVLPLLSSTFCEKRLEPKQINQIWPWQPDS